MWLTSWWVAWLLNFYGFSHTNCMVFYLTPWARYGIPWNCIGTSGNPMAFHGTPRYSKAFHGTPSLLHGTPWNSTELHAIPWNPMDTPWNSMAFHGTPWILHGTPWHSMELHGYSMDTPWKFRGIPWISIYFHGIPWISIDFHRFPWNSMEVFHTCSLFVARQWLENCSTNFNKTLNGKWVNVNVIFTLRNLLNICRLKWTNPPHVKNIYLARQCWTLRISSEANKTYH